MDLTKINLNLLFALDALISECSVTKAGDKLHLSQSATSYLLNQLREIFDDPLLLRTKGKMIPTQLGLELLGPTKEILKSADKLFTIKKPFDPKTHTRTINIGMNDYSIILFLPQLIDKLKKNAPNIKINVKPIGSIDNPELLLKQSIDIAITRLNTDLVTVNAKLLFKDNFVCVCRRSHPGFTKKLTLHQYELAEHVYITFGEKRTFLEPQLKQADIKRNIVMTITNPLAAIFVLSESNYIATILSRLAEITKNKYSLKILPTPFDVNPMPIYQITHRSYANDPCIVWIMDLIQQISKQIKSPDFEC